MSRPPRHHHFLPQFYLRYFTDTGGKDGKLWEFDRILKDYKHKTSRGTCHLPHYYRYNDNDGEKHTDIETGLFHDLENDAKIVIDKLNNEETIDDKERNVLACFVAFQKTMDEASEKMIKKMNKFHCSSVEEAREIINRYNKEKKEDIGISPEEFLRFTQEDKYNVEMPRESSIKSMLQIGNEMASYFLQMDWVFAYAPSNTTFITSDNPFYIIPPGNFDNNCFWTRG